MAGTAAIAVGESVAYVDVPLLDDAVKERDETFRLRITAVPDGLDAQDRSATATVRDDDGPLAAAPKPRVYVDDLWTAEDAESAAFRVRLDRALDTPATIAVSTADATATGGADYEVLTSLLLTIPAGETVLTVPVALRPDRNHEADERFTLKLSAPSANIVVGDASAEANLLDEEGPLHVTVSDARALEGAGPLVFTITLDDAPGPGEVATVAYTISGGDAGTVEFTDGRTAVAVAVADDDAFEPNETVTLTLSAVTPGLVLSDRTGTGTIVNDD